MSKKTKLFQFAAAGLALLFIMPTSVASASAPWQPDVSAIVAGGFDVNYQQGRELLYLSEEGGFGMTGVFSYDPATRAPALCEDPTVKLDCGSGLDVNFGGTAILPHCDSVIQSCLESLEIRDASGVYQKASYDRTPPTDTVFKGDPALGLPNGGSPSIFSSNIIHSGLRGEYTVHASLNFDYFRGQGGGKAMRANEFSLRVFGTESTPRPGIRNTFMKICETTPDGKFNSICGDSDPQCVYQQTNICGVERNAAASTSYRVTMILTNQITGWFRGRLQAPTIDVQPINALYSRVTVSGDPVKVPRFLATFSLAKGDPDIVGPLDQNAHGGFFTIFRAASTRGMEIINGMRERVQDKAAGESTIWSINSIGQNALREAGSNVGQCLSDRSRLLGIVTTNAMAYTGSVPGFEAGFLTYKVAGLHYAPNGKDLNLGTYDLVMRSETARCLYGFTKAPISATVTVVGSGDQSVATTFVTEKDGWLRMSAYGFTFSEKQIKMRLTQPQSRTLSKFSGSSRTLVERQRSEIEILLARSAGNPEVVCTGTYLKPRDRAIATARARAACSYAKSLDASLVFRSEAEITPAANFANRVIISTK